MKALNPYLNFNGNTEEAFVFYKSVFGGTFTTLQRFRETPEAGKVSPKDADKLMHVALPIGNGIVLMGTDSIESGMGYPMVMGTNITLSIEAESKEESDRLFSALSAGGKATMPMADTFWGAYFGMTTDKFGVQWMISFTKNS